jgi:hypothetical protein
MNLENLKVGDLVKPCDSHPATGIVIEVRELKGLNGKNPGQSIFIHWCGGYGQFWTTASKVRKLA